MDIGTPTWTGRSGAAGAPRGFINNSSTPSPRFGKRNAFPINDTPTSSTSNKFGSGTVSGFNSRGNNQGARPSSSTLLAKMRERKAMETGSTSSNTVQGIQMKCLEYNDVLRLELDAPVNILDNTAREGMIVKIRDYLSRNNGKGTSQDIMNNLDLNINQEQVVIFRKMLQAIAKFEKDSAGKGVWILKADFL